MLQSFLNSELLLPSIVCFFVGSFGYIILILWIIPIFKYWSVKRKTIADLFLYCEKHDKGDLAIFKTRLRKHAVALTSIFNSTLPYWYRLYLGNRGEAPPEAAKTIMKLVNTKDKHHMKDQINQILKALNKSS